ncbi:MAG TPA: hypothetical protein DCY51_08225 [Bacteroidetes bacterium]|nr:hypothetical protein [Bacteroidota bacterium]
MKGILSILLLIVSGALLAQDNDTAAIRKAHVKEMRLKQFVHAFDEKKDTCLLDVKKYNEAGKLIYSKRDLICLGWNSSEEFEYTYTDGKMTKMMIYRDGQLFAKNEYIYTQESNDPQSTIGYLMETKDAIFTNFKYFKSKSGRLDSTYSYEKQGDGSEVVRRNIIRYDKKDNIVQVSNALEGDKVLDMVSYERGKNGEILGMAYTTYGENPQFVQTYYEYNQDDQIAKTTDTRNRTQLYFYTAKGLLNNVLTYNGKGGLEVEFIYEYEFYR